MAEGKARERLANLLARPDRRKPLPGKAFHRLGPAGLIRHHGQYVTVTQCSAPAGHPTMKRLRDLGINLLGARNTASQSLAVEVPPPLVAELLGYSYNVTHRHAEIAAQPWARYVKAADAHHKH